MYRYVMRIHAQARLTAPTARENLWLAVTNPWDIEESDKEIERLSLDVPLRDARLIEQFAAYRNKLASVQGKRLKKTWSRKSMAEQALAIQCDEIRTQLKAMTDELGPLPEPKDDAALEKYARRVVAWNAKHDKQNK